METHKSITRGDECCAQSYPLVVAWNQQAGSANQEIELTMENMNTPVVAPIKRKRIFWLGMHNVLMQTELPRLRMLGYEVFHSPYLSDVIDQSAVREWAPPRLGI